MGCITSTNNKKLHDLRHDNVFRVRVAHLQPSGPGTPIIRSGYLELTPRELIFLTQGCEPIVWALQHLRRYGLNGDLFSFEAGRRCMSGPGIYTFRVHNAESLYPMFQTYINAVNTDAFAQVERERVNSTHSVHPHSNNYLEPAPLLARTGNANNPVTSDTANTTDSPDSLPNLQLQFNTATVESGTSLQSPITPGAYINTNVYFDQPLRAFQEQQQNNANQAEAATTLTATISTTAMPVATSVLTSNANGSCSAFSTIRRRTLLKGCSLDMPPQETAPMLNDSTLHMYANVDTPPSSCSLRDRLLFDLNGSDRCYENINRLDLPLLLQTGPQRENSQQSVASNATANQQPATPTSLGVASGVNYIVLDLDQPRSPAQCSPRTMALNNGFGSGLSLSNSMPAVQAQTAPVTPEASTGLEATGILGNTQAQSLNSVNDVASANNANKTSSVESSQGYSTIDFIRTYALNKSTTAPHGSELPVPGQNAHEAEELRITRHSKCIRKAYSISE